MWEFELILVLLLSLPKNPLSEGIYRCRSTLYPRARVLYLLLKHSLSLFTYGQGETQGMRGVPGPLHNSKYSQLVYWFFRRIWKFYMILAPASLLSEEEFLTILNISAIQHGGWSNPMEVWARENEKSSKCLSLMKLLVRIPQRPSIPNLGATGRFVQSLISELQNKSRCAQGGKKKLKKPWGMIFQVLKFITLNLISEMNNVRSI